MFDLDAANINGVMPENIVDIYIAYTLCIKIMMKMCQCLVILNLTRSAFVPTIGSWYVDRGSTPKQKLCR